MLFVLYHHFGLLNHHFVGEIFITGYKTIFYPQAEYEFFLVQQLLNLNLTIKYQ